ncbi:ABC transporter ATP-binding protein [Pararhizobium haloflavum]|uniref:ABC transporter ATP-binding protein n=1 Tax=Pararhizobium haloflavum TaxID=2037914 RepID=UPI000C19CBD5
MSPVGGASPLEVRIRRKSFASADRSETEVLRDLAFSLAPATFNCLIGPSGCGKTTTLRILLGLDRDYDGTVRWPKPDMRIAAVFQEPRLLPWRTVDQNVRLALPDGASPDLDTLYRVLGLAEMRTRYPAELSLGLERRVALARAFAVMPDVLLLDEPFVSLDEHTADRLRDLLVDLAVMHAVTVLMVTHNVREAARMADRLLLINGRPARIVGDVMVPMPRSARHGTDFGLFLEQLMRQHPGTVRI